MNRDKKKVTPMKKTKKMVFVAIFSVLICVFAWITIPTPVPFTMQTFGILVTLGLLGGKLGTASILLYLALGAIGLPVFHSFTGGIGVFVGPTGGYLIGFIFTGLIFWLITDRTKDRLVGFIVASILGILACYAFGTAWFVALSLGQNNSVSILSVLTMCVFPFLLPDGLKITLAIVLTKSLIKPLHRYLREP